jgi:hypothetical protein
VFSCYRRWLRHVKRRYDQRRAARIMTFAPISTLRAVTKCANNHEMFFFALG